MNNFGLRNMEQKLLAVAGQPKTFFEIDIQQGDVVTYRIRGEEKGGPARTVKAKVLQVYPHIIVTKNRNGYRECFNIGHYLCGKIISVCAPLAKNDKRMSVGADMRKL